MLIMDDDIMEDMHDWKFMLDPSSSPLKDDCREWAAAEWR